MTDTVDMVEADKQRLGRYFRHYREAANITLRDMAERMGMSINTIRWHEAGLRLLRVPEIWKAADILGVTPDRLLDPAIDPTT
jgi:transcriptional regulator with XRE-family HTH domain